MRCLVNKASLARLKNSLLMGYLLTAMSVATHASETTHICEAGETGASLLVKVTNIQYLEGNLRAQLYGSNLEKFLVKGTKLVRIDTPVKQVGEQHICLPVPKPDTYAVVILHDRNANGKTDFFTEGVGFSKNPKLKLSPPDAEDVMIEVPPGVLHVPVELYYIMGSENENKVRRKMRRR